MSKMPNKNLRRFEESLILRKMLLFAKSDKICDKHLALSEILLLLGAISVVVGEGSCPNRKFERWISHPFSKKETFFVRKTKGAQEVTFLLTLALYDIQHCLFPNVCSGFYRDNVLQPKVVSSCQFSNIEHLNSKSV